MTDRYFIEDQSLVNKYLKDLSPLNENTGWQCELYLDNMGKQKWEKYLFEIVDSDEDGVGLRKYPYPLTQEIIRIALSSQYYDEVDGACALLLRNEGDKIEFREKLISEIEININEITKYRYDIIYNRAELYDASNKREIVGKHNKQINADVEHYKLMVKRAEKLKQTVQE